MKMPIALLAGLGMTVASCATAGSSCGDVTPLAGAPGGALPEPGQLQAALHRVIQAHCDCDFAPDVMELIPDGVDGQGSWANVDASCLGPIEVVEWSPKDGVPIAIYVLQQGKAKRAFFERYLIMGNFVEGRWLFSWPTGLGQRMRS